MITWIRGLQGLVLGFRIEGFGVCWAGVCLIKRANVGSHRVPGFGGPQSLDLQGSVHGGSWVVINGVISPLIWVIITVTLQRTLLRSYP